MSTIDPDATLGALVAERPARAPLIERCDSTYCCGGSQTLAEACTRRGLDRDTVRTMLVALDEEADERQGVEGRRLASREELCAHIVAVHHDGLRAALPRIEALLSTVVRVHGHRHRSLTTCGEPSRGSVPKSSHISSEEDVPFPACLALEQHGLPIDAALLDRHEH